MPDGTKHTYEIFSVNKVKDLGFAYTTSFGSKFAFKEHKNLLLEESMYDCEVDQTDARLVTLSTCDDIGSSRGNRIIIVGQEKEVKKTQEQAKWYEKRQYIEINNKEATALKGNNYYYVVQDEVAIRCRKEDVTNLISPNEEESIVRVEYVDTSEAYKYQELNGEIFIYPILDIIDYQLE